jgi:predicted permease
MAGVLDDLKFAVRLLRRSPAFGAVAVLTLALGIGANTAIFSLIRGVLLKPLGYPAPERLVFISSQFPTLGFDQFWISPPEFFELKERSRSFSSVGAFRTGAVNLGTATEPRRVNAAVVTADLFTTLGVPALLGRTFTPEETLPNAAPTIVLSHDTWQRTFGGDPGMVGRLIEVDGVKTTVVGVMPAGFDVYDARLEVFQPVQLDPAERTRRRGNHFLYLIGRLRPGVSLAQARVELNSLLASWKQAAGGEHAPTTDNHRLRYDDLLGQVVGDVRRALWVLQAAVLCVLLIACANLANLLLARGETRQREFAVRAALGAGRGHLMRQFAIEGVVIAVLGGIVGTLAAWLVLRGLPAAGLEALPRATDVALDGPVLAFTLALALVTGVLFGLAPILHAGDASLGVALKEGGSRTSTARGRVRRLLVMAEIAAAVVLVVSATLLLRTFWNLMQVDAGFPRERLLTFGLVLPDAVYEEGSRKSAFFAGLLQRLEAAAGVERAAAVRGLPPLREVDANDTEFEGIRQGPGTPPQNVDYYQAVTTGYFDTMKIPIVEGRRFLESDANPTAPVALVNQTLARRFWPGQSAIGRRLRPGFGDRIPWFTVVGVVADVKQGGVAEPVGTELYFSFEQAGVLGPFVPSNMNVVVRTALPISTVAGIVRREVANLDATLPVVNLRTMELVFEETLSRPRLLARLLGAFAGLALLLAVVGTYGVLAYTVAERRREIGVRMALGADRSRVLGMVLGEGMVLAGVGLVAGIAGALMATRVMTTLLYGVKPTDPLTLAGVSMLVLLVALAACYVPARRASAVDPMLVLREE